MPRKFICKGIAALSVSLVVTLFLTVHEGIPQGMNDLGGTVVDARSGQPIKGAKVTAGNTVVLTDEQGHFSIPDSAAAIGVRACGYARVEAPILMPPGSPPPVIALTPFTAKALYLTYYGIGDRHLRENALKLIGETELNSLVIDIKGDHGVITYKSDIPLAGQIGAQKLLTVKDIKGLLKSLKGKGVHTIGRIVVFKDDVLGKAWPDAVVRTSGGEVWHDREGLIWLDPARKEVWEYNIAIAEEAARNGFDEIQFDYVRFPDHKGLVFSVPNTQTNRVRNITGFLRAAQERLAPYNVFVSADIFGYVAWNPDDTQIGQTLDSIAPCVDYLSLMLYPSGFSFGIPGFLNPVAHPHEIVARTLAKAQHRTGLPPVRFRPWLQGFRDYAFDRRQFEGPEIRTQIEAAESFGSGGWMLWNPRNVYHPEGLNMKQPEPEASQTR